MLHGVNSSQSDEPEQGHRHGIDSDNQGPVRPSEPCAARHSSSTRNEVPRRFWGAIAAVSFTVSGALALSFGFAKVIAEAIAITPDQVELRVRWSENEDWNSEDLDPEPFVKKVRSGSHGYHDGYLMVWVTRSELKFDSIKDEAGWPPELGEERIVGERGLLTYQIEVTKAGKPRDARYIVRGSSPDRFLLLVPDDLTVSQIGLLGGKEVFEANRDGVIKLAQKEKAGKK